MWRTDGQTQRRTPHDGTGRACIASRGKNQQLSARAGHVCLHTTTWFSPDVFRLILQSRQSLVRWCLSEWTKSFHADLVASSCQWVKYFLRVVELLWSRSNICYFGHSNPLLIDWLIAHLFSPTNEHDVTFIKIVFCSRKHFYIQSVNL